MLFVSYEDTLRQGETNLRNLSIAFSAQTFSVAQAVENVMLQAERGYASKGASAPAADALANFGENSLAREYLLGIHLYDNEGRLVASGVPAKPHTPARPSPGEIRSAIDAKLGALRVTITDVDPMTGRGVINFTRPTVDAAGTRTGTILAQADSECFERIYSLVELGKGGSVTLFNRDGSRIFRLESASRSPIRRCSSNTCRSANAVRSPPSVRSTARTGCTATTRSAPIRW